MSAGTGPSDPGAGVLYRSTRSARGAGAVVTFEEAVLAGPAPDGGLYVPAHYPALPGQWREAPSLPEMAKAVLPPYMGESAAAAVGDALDFPVELVEVGDDLVLELFHGPTNAFKDVGARSLARLMELYLRERGSAATILVATSGDTGGAVADAFAGLRGLQVALLFPRDGVSDIQEAQLTAARPGVRAFAVDGTFDDCQRLVKGAFRAPELAPLGLTSANSINIGRLLPQMLYYLWAVAELGRRGRLSGALRVVVPSGNLGNLTAGLLALAPAPGGAPAPDVPRVEFLAAHNRNDYFVRYLAGGAPAFEYPASVATPSNAMDVGAPSNFERLHDIYGESLRGLVRADAVDDGATYERMRAVFEQTGYFACPHTAVGLEVSRRARAVEEMQTLVLSTAHPAKFPEAVEAATGVRPAVPERLAAFEAAPKRVERLAATGEALTAALLAKPEFD